jgi:peptidoglycan/LPS O-acetylase OafA/YrhL
LLILLLLINDKSLFSRLFRHPLLTWLGSISFGVYLIHQPVSGILHASYGNPVPLLNSWQSALITLLALCITLALAQLSYTRFESRMLKLGHRFKYQQRSST